MNLENLICFHDSILVRALAQPTRSKGGLHLPETARERPVRGIVLVVGPGAYNESGTRNPLEVQVGDLVCFGCYAGQEVDTDEALICMREMEATFGMRAGSFTVIEHEDPRLNHLAGDACELCDGPAEAEAESALAKLRADLVKSRDGEPQTSAEPPDLTPRLVGGSAPVPEGGVR